MYMQLIHCVLFSPNPNSSLSLHSLPHSHTTHTHTHTFSLPTFVYDHLLQPSLAGGPLHDALVDGVARHKPVHHDRLRLPDAVAPVHSLQVCLGVLGAARGRGDALTVIIRIYIIYMHAKM